MVFLLRKCCRIKGKKAVFSLFSKIQDDYFNTEILQSLFDTYVKRIVNYGY